jgi:hypothetical protein
MTDSTLAPAPAEVPYAPPPPWHRRRAFRRAGLAAAVLFLALFAWRWGRTALRETQSFYWQRQCLAYAPADGWVVFDDDPARAAVLLAGQGYVRSHSAFGQGTYAIHDAQPWQTYRGVGRRSFGRAPAAPVVFMHRRTSPAGHERLVAVQIGYVVGTPREEFNRLNFHPFVETTRSVLPGKKLVQYDPSNRGLNMFRRLGDGTRLLAGRPDPADASHFTIDYVHNGTPGTIDGWLNDDESVTLAPRAGRVCRETMGAVWWSPAGAPMARWADDVGTYDVAAEPISPHAQPWLKPFNPMPRPRPDAPKAFPVTPGR